MSEFVSAAPSATALLGARIGFCGKLPTRGDFVTAVLPRRFVDPWHDWMQRGLRVSREALGDRWLAAWLEAPVWNYVLSPGVCGPDAVLGLWMPSVDRVGRHFPLTIAAVVPGGDPATLLGAGGAFLDIAEAAGRNALADELDPDAVASRIATPLPPTECRTGGQTCPPGGALWWGEGSGRVPACCFSSLALPESADFVAMIDASGGRAVGWADVPEARR
jgi:type VI secretion system protein ImpM